MPQNNTWKKYFQAEQDCFPRAAIQRKGYGETNIWVSQHVKNAKKWPVTIQICEKTTEILHFAKITTPVFESVPIIWNIFLRTLSYCL
jgi:hypothetical protein